MVVRSSVVRRKFERGDMMNFEKNLALEGLETNERDKSGTNVSMK